MTERSDPRLTAAEAERAGQLISAILDNIEQVIIGKRVAAELILAAMLAGGHVLIEDVPGVGKTSLVSAVAKSIDCTFRRIQFTPDLMPSDVTGFSVYNQKTGEFEFRPGGVMSHLVLADEINRAGAKTQSSLLEAMEERQVTVDSVTYPLEPPFMVLATQNPVEALGTYPLPEAQLDRFLLKFSMGYPTLEEETRVVMLPRRSKQELAPAASREDILDLMALTERVYAAPPLIRYAVELTGATRASADTILGASPRGSIALCRAAQALALLRGRSYVLPDDIKYLAPYVLPHRIVLSHEARLEGKTAESVVRQALDSIVVPVGTEE